MERKAKIFLIVLLMLGVNTALAVEEKPALFDLNVTSALPGDWVSSRTVGWTFTVNGTAPGDNISVTRLGVYDHEGNGLGNSHPIGLWDSGGTLMVSTSIPSGTSSPLIGGYRYVDITPIELVAGQSYTIGVLMGLVAPNDHVIQYASASADSAITPETWTEGIRSRDDESGVLAKPWYALNDQQGFNANFQFTTADTIPPVITCPGNTTIEAMGPDGVPIDDYRIQTFLAGASATDNCDPNPVITNDAPSIFPTGDTIVTFTATDVSGNSSSCSSTVTVVEAAEAHLGIIPPIINREGRLTEILAVIRFPDGITEDDIDMDEPLILLPGDSLYYIEADYQWIVTWHRWGKLYVSMFGFFPKDDIMDVITENGLVDFMVVGQLVNGQYFYGIDTVRIISWHW